MVSNLLKIFLDRHSNGVKEVDLFGNGCVGQNHNSRVPSMMLYFVKNSACVEKNGLNYFETNHGQSEGDGMHCTIDRYLEQQTKVFLPAQLASICRMAK